MFADHERESFFRSLVKSLDRKEDHPNEFIRAFVDGMRPAIPAKPRTDKGMNRVKRTILIKLKVLYSDFGPC
jgi:hypothetical protein